jgi:hypothetical protein
VAVVRGRFALADRHGTRLVLQPLDVPAHERIGELEGAILDPLGIQAAVGPVVDVFEEDPPHRRADRQPRLAGMDRERDGGLHGGRRRGDRSQERSKEKST